MKRLFRFLILVVLGTLLLTCVDNTKDAWGNPLQGNSNGLEIADLPMGVILGRLRALGHRICFEEVRIDTVRDRIVDAQGQMSWKKKKISLSRQNDANIEEALEILVAFDDSYDWYRYEDSTLYVVYPTTEKNPNSNESDMMREIEPIDVKDKKLQTILEEDFKILDHNISLSMRGNREVLERTFSATIPVMPFMEALNELLVQENDLYWALGGLSKRILYIGTTQ